MEHELTTEQWKEEKRKKTDPKTGEKYGWGRVLDYIGVGWEDWPSVQMSIYDFPEYLPDSR